MSRFKECLPFKIIRGVGYDPAVQNSEGEIIEGCLTEEDAQFIVAACNYHERMKEILRMISGDTAKTHLDGTPLFSVRMASQMAKDILKELEESCKEK